MSSIFAVTLGGKMLRITFVALALFVAGAGFQQPVFARSMESGDAIVARKATPAVVNISTWKVRAPEKPTTRRGG